MATHDARSTTLSDFGLEPSVVAREHTPSLHPRERFVRCTTCGVTAPYAVTAEGPIRRALEELASVRCGTFELPDVPVGEHLPTVTPERPGYGRNVVCESCGRAAPLGDDRERVLEELAEIPCIDGLSYVELVDLVFSPNDFTPLLADLGISNWYGVEGGRHGDDVQRLFRHERFQYTVYIRRNADETATAALTGAPTPTREPLAELHFPNEAPASSVTRETAVTLVRFLSATDPMSAGEFDELKSAYDAAYKSHREAWLSNAYEVATETFRERFGGTPEAFTEVFTDGAADVEQALRRMVGSNGFDDLEEAVFAREVLGHDHEFPGFVGFVADNHAWTPPVPDP